MIKEISFVTILLRELNVGLFVSISFVFEHTLLQKDSGLPSIYCTGKEEEEEEDIGLGWFFFTKILGFFQIHQ